MVEPSGYLEVSKILIIIRKINENGLFPKLQNLIELNLHFSEYKKISQYYEHNIVFHIILFGWHPVSSNYQEKYSFIKEIR